jgi:hypothetical protein
MRKPIAAAVVVCVFVSVVSVLVVGTLWHQKESYANAYEKLTVGTPKSEVVKAFGTPTRTSKCDLVPSWDGGRPLRSNECVEEYWYGSRISPEQWTIGFDVDGHVVTKYYFVSP